MIAPENNKQVALVRSEQKSFVLKVAETATPQEIEGLQFYFQRLLEIRDQQSGPVSKIKAVIDVTIKSKAIWSILKVFARKIKEAGWDDRSSRTKTAIWVSAVTATVFGGKMAGVAALGGAIGVPLWIIFGAGSMFAHDALRILAAVLERQSSE